jgi:hypothetical protein
MTTQNPALKQGAVLMVIAALAFIGYAMVTAMKAPLPRPRTMTFRGKRQQSDDNRAPAQAAAPAPSEPSFMAFSSEPVCTGTGRIQQNRPAEATGAGPGDPAAGSTRASSALCGTISITPMRNPAATILTFTVSLLSPVRAARMFPLFPARGGQSVLRPIDAVPTEGPGLPRAKDIPCGLALPPRSGAAE